MRRWYYAVPLLAAAMAWGCTADKNPTAPLAPAHAHADAIPVTGAGFTSINSAQDAVGGLTVADLCQNGNPNNNCNIYKSKSYVWLNGGPSNASIGNGVYFFAVLTPGGQSDPNDGATDNLSDFPAAGTGGGDLYTNRIFTVTNGTISYGGSHDFANNKIRLMGYDDTTNPGGEYIMALCYLGPDTGHETYPVAASKCKYDAFKVRPAGTVVVAEAPTITKDVNASYNHTFTWAIGKSVDKTKVSALFGNATFKYTVTVTVTDAGLSNFAVGGNITVTNSNADNMTATITDALSDGTICSVTGGAAATLTPGENVFAYSCPVPWTAVPDPAAYNTATVKWDAQTLAAGSLAAGSDQFQIVVTPDEHLIDPSVTVTDTYAGTLGTMSNTDATPKTFTYSRTVPIPTSGCTTYDNTATYTTSTTNTTGSASQSVQACRVPPNTGALTMGFWQNKNGQGIIISAGSSTCTKLGTFLSGYNPFKDLPNSTCTGIASYVMSVINAANAGGTSMNPMLKAQMLATSLDVFFSDPALGGNKIGAFNGLGTHQTPIGAFLIDLVYPEDVRAAFGGSASLTVTAMLSYAASQSDAGGVTWYAQNKVTQGLAKDAFDSINNNRAFEAGP